MTTLIFDLETDNLLDKVTKVHILATKDVVTGVSRAYRSDGGPGNTIEDGIKALNEATVIIGHNAIRFDVPVLVKLYPELTPIKARVLDTILMARLVWPDLKSSDLHTFKRGKLPGKLVGSHSLEAWGHRLGVHKGDFKGPWDKLTEEMVSYCLQDLEVTCTLYTRLKAKLDTWSKDGFWPRAVQLEHDVAAIVHRQEMNGFAFDEKSAHRLHAELVQRRVEIEAELQAAFPPETVDDSIIPKANNKKLGYVKGELVKRTRIVEFNPGSRDQVAERLTKKYGWVPKDFTDTGKPKIDDDVLSSLEWPEAKLLSEYFILNKVIGYLSEGKEAWLRAVRNGRIHGSVNTNGAVTGRMTHSRPNLANIPSSGSPHGSSCRALFIPKSGMKLVGCDADALEMRCLAHYLTRYDGGAFIKTILEGKKEDGTDMHTQNAKVLGITRDQAKTWFYAWLYGAGDEKLGWTSGVHGEKKHVRGGFYRDAKAAARGAADRKKFLVGFPTLGALVEDVKATAKARGYLTAIDGRRVPIRSGHAALNTLLQSAGAIVMKVALVQLDKELQGRFMVPGLDYEFVNNVHDEWQIEVQPHIADMVGELAANAITKAGEQLGFRCPLKGNFVVGNNWSETH